MRMFRKDITWRAVILYLTLFLFLFPSGVRAQENVGENCRDSVSCHHVYVKTNTIGLAMLVANAAVEVDLAGHWSFVLPVYYSAWDYFKSTLKFRTFCLQPEVRYWFDEANDGWFAGAHLGYAYYNYALDGSFRTQDHNRKTPSVGGGVSVGYRMPVSKDKRWRMEFSLGGGVYDSHYDKFHNEPNGRLIGDYRKTFFGIDQVNVSVVYRIEWKKGGRK